MNDNTPYRGLDGPRNNAPPAPRLWGWRVPKEEPEAVFYGLHLFLLVIFTVGALLDTCISGRCARVVRVDIAWAALLVLLFLFYWRPKP